MNWCCNKYCKQGWRSATSGANERAWFPARLQKNAMEECKKIEKKELLCRVKAKLPWAYVPCSRSCQLIFATLSFPAGWVHLKSPRWSGHVPSPHCILDEHTQGGFCWSQRTGQVQNMLEYVTFRQTEYCLKCEPKWNRMKEHYAELRMKHSLVSV